MHKIYSKYYILAAVVIVFGIVAGLFHIYGVAPLKKRVQSREQSISETIESLRKRGWPVEHKRLEKLLSRRKNEFERLDKKNRHINQLIDTTFRKRISEHFGEEAVQNPRAFRQYVSRLDYQELYTSIISKWESREVFLTEELINLSKNTVSGHIYRLILKLWSLDTVLDLATENGLSVVTVSGTAESVDNGQTGTESEKASLVLTPPVREYYLAQSDEAPYLLGLPVAMEVKCTTRELMNFLRTLISHDALVVLNHIEIKKQPFENDENGKRYRNSLKVKLSCSTFYRLGESGGRKSAVGDQKPVKEALRGRGPGTADNGPDSQSKSSLSSRSSPSSKIKD